MGTAKQSLMTVYSCGCRHNTEPRYQYCPLHSGQPVQYSYVPDGLGDISGLTRYCLPEGLHPEQGEEPEL